ncbi:hypothetical protein [Labrys monachus]|uniref:Uncharacterized protein n=1 Tax=Labrys monachus TaxID=217067 RepID=A0ABU0FCX7_9HYPH|nr:hypothetical protein [Labrys monachus]MDQ0392177.1 hypothetical protein [Labrys monachus]
MSAPIEWEQLAPLIGVVAIVGGAFWRAWSMVQAVRDEIAGMRLEVARDYVSARSARDIEMRLAAAIERLGDRLDRAFDKAGS